MQSNKPPPPTPDFVSLLDEVKDAFDGRAHGMTSRDLPRFLSSICVMRSHEVIFQYDNGKSQVANLISLLQLLHRSLEPDEPLIAEALERFIQQPHMPDGRCQTEVLRALLEELPTYSHVGTILNTINQGFPSQAISSVSLALGSPLLDGGEGWAILVDLHPDTVLVAHLKSCCYQPHVTQGGAQGGAQLRFTMCFQAAIDRTTFDLRRVEISYPKFDATRYPIVVDNPPALSLKTVRRILCGYDSRSAEMWYLCKTSQFERLLECVDPRVINVCARDFGVAHFAAHQNKHMHLDALVRRGLNLDNKTRYTGQTPLHIAAAQGHKACVQELLRLGADPTILNRDDQFPADVAATPEIANLLQRLHLRTATSLPVLPGAVLDNYGSQRFALASSLEPRYVACLTLSAVGDALGFRCERCGSYDRLVEDLDAHGGLAGVCIRMPDYWASFRTLLLHATAAALAGAPVGAFAPHPEEVAALTTAVANTFIERYGANREPHRGFTERLDLVLGLLAGRAATWDALPQEPKATESHPSLLGVAIGLLLPCPAQIDALIALSLNVARVTDYNPIAQLGCLVGAVFTSYAVQNVPISRWAKLLLQNVLPRTPLSDIAKKWADYDRGIETQTQRVTPQFSPVDHKRFLERNAQKHNIQNAGSSGDDCPLIAYDAVLHATDFEDLCRRAVLHEGRASATAGLAFAWFGLCCDGSGVRDSLYTGGELATRARHYARSLFHAAKHRLHGDSPMRLQWWNAIFAPPADPAPAAK
eukprot:gnl/Trimastix_PCT/2172.p1 GENE.gnl/Trimastix_PCT/2172~~gnl/Trimastix_PCT/2172.p1  ORF type:complete len:762 (-),score=228.14 gnl/Trimastix_PCT/2172:20-2305(-)